VTSPEARNAILSQPYAFKAVYTPADHYVNGHVVVKGPDCWHLFYSGVGGGGNERKLHATSDDLLTWTPQKPVLACGGSGEWDEGEVGDCCVIADGGRWYMLYVGKPRLPASRRFGVAVSEDLWHWVKVPGNGSSVFRPSSSWSGWQETGVVECKDPWITRCGGDYLMYYACRDRAGASCIAVARSDDLLAWKDEGPVVSMPWVESRELGPAGFECPRVVRHAQKYYLFAMYFGGYRYAVGSEPYNFGPWEVLGSLHAAVIFNDRDRWFITHAFRTFGKANFRGKHAGPSRGLYLGGLAWVEGRPVLTDLADVMDAPN
jgi:hypothetical protein